MWELYLIATLCLLTLAFFVRLRRYVGIRRDFKVFTNEEVDGSMTGGKKAPRTFGVFHPYADAAGGGERVLWFLIYSIIDLYPSSKEDEGNDVQSEQAVEVVLYVRNSAISKDHILRSAEKFFGKQYIDSISSRIRVVFLSSERLLDSKMYPRLTLIGQSLGSVIVATEAIMKFHPDVFIDTTGYAFTYPLVYALSFLRQRPVKIVSYTHYPTISTNMLEKVNSRKIDYNNNRFIARSKFISRIKYYYYCLFALFYGWCGRFSDKAMVNSKWTQNHIEKIWKREVDLVYPPCNIKVGEGSIKQQRSGIVSLGQFRPEKNHKLQIKALTILVKKLREKRKVIPKFYLCGGCRGMEDYSRVEKLRQLARTEGVEEHVEFLVNLPLNRLKSKLSQCLIGVHTMKDEHFGISPVEMMASGLIVVCHKSGGPESDIVTNSIDGYLAETPEEYADVIESVLDLNETQRATIREKCREKVKMFNDDVFINCVKKSLSSL